MKANEFVKQFGWEYAFNAVNLHHTQPYAIAVTVYDGNLSYAVSMSYGFTYISELKRLVESWELVKDLYGIERAKQYADSPYTAPEVVEAVKLAIKDVESCQ